GWFGAAQRIPGGGCRGDGAGCRSDTGGPQRLELSRGQFTEPAKRRPSGERADDDQLGHTRRGARQREHIQELELVVKVMLEPQDDLLPPLQRPPELPVASLQRGQDRRPAAPPAGRQERGPGTQQFPPRSRWHWSFVEDVLPRQDRAAERGL